MSLEHRKRWIAALVGSAFLFGTYYFARHYGLIALTIAISALAYNEFLSFSGASKHMRWLSVGAGALLCTWLSLDFPGALTAVYAAALAVLLRGLFRAHRVFSDLILSEFLNTETRIFGLVYLVVFPSFVPKIHALAHGPWLLLFLLILIWLGDVAAYYGGKLLGKHKLSPNISPGKTIEGAAACLIFCAIATALYHRFVLSHLPLYKLELIALLTSVVAQSGDLLESLMKRAYQVKDSGALIPGHGGVFDRFDSLIFAAPFFYMLLALLG